MLRTVTLLLLLASSPALAQDRSHARSMVLTRDGIVATSHVQASVAGAQILAKGGSAVDAAIAANVNQFAKQLAASRFGFENWSHDGKYLYAEDYPEKVDDFVRVNVSDGKVERMFSLIQLGDFTSYYMAVVNDTDPTPVEAIDTLKRALA